MNIFYLHPDPKKCVQMHLDKHVNKMLIEYAQLMATAHRVLDGKEYEDRTKNGRRIKRWYHPTWNDELYLAAHVNHPSAIWVRQSDAHYRWLYRLWAHLHDEWMYRHDKEWHPNMFHKSYSSQSYMLVNTPKNLLKKFDIGTKYPTYLDFLTPPPQAMPDYCKRNDTIAAYKNYYIKEKSFMHQWTKRETPTFIKEHYAAI